MTAGTLSLAPASAVVIPGIGTAVLLTYRPADPSATVTLFTVRTTSGTVEATAIPIRQTDGTWIATVNLPDGSHILTATLTDAGGTYDDPVPDRFTTPARSPRQPGEPIEPWVTVAQLRTNTALSALSDEQLAEAAQSATDLLWALSGRQYAGPRVARVLLYAPRCDWHRRSHSTHDGFWGNPHEAREWTLNGLGCSCVSVTLPDAQVVKVLSVSIDGVTVPPETYRLDDRRTLVRLDSSWPLSSHEADERLAVTYVHGVDPPAGGRRAARALATSYAKAALKGCGIPSRATSVTADGITIVLDDLDTYRQGGTGVTEADSWIVSVNPHRNTRRASVLSPDGVRARRPYV